VRNFAVAEPAFSTEVNAASFDASHDDIFNRIASRYDLLCDLFSLFIHRLWKSRMARRILALPWQCMLDVASGTGDIALRVVGNLDAEMGRTCIVSDICPAMLDVARRRATPLANAVQFKTLDAHRLTTIETASIDLYSMSLGMKICDRKLALAEAWRVLRPGGTFICLEASEIPVRFLHRAYLIYMRLCMPVVGWAATGGDTSAYDYLLKGVCGFPSAQKFADEIAAQGFVEVTYERLSLGIVAIHSARKPDPDGRTGSRADNETRPR
jgi:demethylmenaquinone methyltransferase / 2-methoxy-6-polyprenyl-1,4-benzoquinol methylase